MIRLAARPAGVALLVALALGAGCSTSKTRYFYGGLSNPFGRAYPEDERRYGPIQKDIRAEIRDVAQRASRMSPQEQEQSAYTLSERLQTETNPVLRVEIVRALAQLSTQSAELALQMALTDSDKRVRIAAIEGWERRPGPQAIGALSRVTIEEKDVDVRLAAVRALGELKRPEAASALVAVLEENNPALQQRAVESLQAISGRNYGGDKHAWQLYAQGTPPPEPRREHSWAERILPWR